MKPLGFGLLALVIASCAVAPAMLVGSDKGSPKRKDKVVHTDAEWKKLLNPKAYHILREEGTEPSFSNDLYKNHEVGAFYCAGCGNLLFKSEDKFESGTGWPSYVKPANKLSVWKKGDLSDGMDRDEIKCAKCDGHLGHVFDDGPPDRGGLRYCIDGDALVFKKAEKKK